MIVFCRVGIRDCAHNLFIRKQCDQKLRTFGTYPMAVGFFFCMRKSDFGRGQFFPIVGVDFSSFSGSSPTLTVNDLALLLITNRSPHKLSLRSVCPTATATATATLLPSNSGSRLSTSLSFLLYCLLGRKKRVYFRFFILFWKNSL